MRKRKSPSFSTTTTKKTAQIIFSGFIFYTLFRGCTNSKFNSLYSSFFICEICRIKNHLTSHFIQYEIITLCSWYGILIIRLSNWNHNTYQAPVLTFNSFIIPYWYTLFRRSLILRFSQLWKNREISDPWIRKSPWNWNTRNLIPI